MRPPDAVPRYARQLENILEKRSLCPCAHPSGGGCAVALRTGSRGFSFKLETTLATSSVGRPDVSVGTADSNGRTQLNL